MKKCGFWESLIDLKLFEEPPLNFQELRVFQDKVFWIESRPLEKGRNTLMSFDFADGIKEETSEFNVQTKIHEYGGGAFKCFNGSVIFSVFGQGVYLKDSLGHLRMIIEDKSKRFADFSLSPDGKTLIAVCEDHSIQGNPENYLVMVNVLSGHIKVIEKGKAFYASCQFSPDGGKVAFLSWDFPFMPWESCLLTVADWSVEDGIQSRLVVGGESESVCQFIWTKDKEIIFASDRSGFWNLYSWDLEIIAPICPLEADFASPLWVLGRKNFSLFSWKGKRALLCVFTRQARDFICVITLDDKGFYVLDLPYTVIRTLDVEGAFDAYFVGGSPLIPLSIVRLNLETTECVRIRESFVLRNELTSYFSVPEEIACVSSVDGAAIFGFYYPPKNPAYSIDENNKPPLIIKCHGGPTSHTVSLFNLEVQFWTSRGFAFLDVNYRGSTGFGKAYRQALEGGWGVLDVQDCLDSISYLIQRGDVLSEGVFAKGSSSGGFTALHMAMSGLLRGCVSVYGVTDLVFLAEDTHKFEKHYLDFLVGDKESCLRRSPVAYPQKITCPVLFLHGAADSVVPLIQAERLLKELGQGELVVFAGEGHGFRFASTIQKCLDVELSFYQDKLSSSRM